MPLIFVIMNSAMYKAVCPDLLGELGRYCVYPMFQSQGEVDEDTKHLGDPVTKSCASPGELLIQGVHTLNLEGKLSRKRRTR